MSSEILRPSTLVLVLMRDFPSLGIGCSLRGPDISQFLQTPPLLDWVEIIAEEHLDWSDGRKLASTSKIEAIRENFSVTVHGVSLSLGSTEPLNLDHLKRIKELLSRLDATWFSEHLSWSNFEGAQFHEQLPLPYSKKTIEHLAERILQTQDFLKRKIIVENISNLVRFDTSEMTEWEFLSEISDKTECALLLDLSNLHDTYRTLGINPIESLKSFPLRRLAQIHIAPTSPVLTTDSFPPSGLSYPNLWEILNAVQALTGALSTTIEPRGESLDWENLQTHIEQSRPIAKRGEKSDPTYRDSAPV